MEKWKPLVILTFLIALFFMPIIKTQSPLSQHDLIFNTSLPYETPFIDLRLVKFKLQAEVNIGPQFTLTSSQNLRDAGTPDTITVSLSPKGFTGDLTLKAIDGTGKVLASQSLPFKIDRSPLGKTNIPLPEVGLTIIIGVVTISPRLVIESSMNSKVQVEGPATLSMGSLQWTSEGQRTVSVKFETDKKHVTVNLTNLNYVLNAFLEIGIKAIGFELAALKTPSITRSVIGSPSSIMIGDYNAVPTASFTFTPVEPTVADDVRFTDTSSDDDGNIVAWSWNFGDGTTSTEHSPSHKFREGGYTITLTVTDDKGATDSTSKSILVKARPAGAFPLPIEHIIIIIMAVMIMILAAVIIIRRR